MGTLDVETTEGVRLSFEIAGTASRATAFLIDLVLFGLGLFALLLAFAAFSAWDPSGASQFVWGLLSGGLLVLFLSYQALLPLVWGGRTVGKAFLGLRVRDADGHPAGPGALLLRAFLLPIDLLPLVPLPLGVVLVAGSERAQRLGDVVASTLVLRDPPAYAPAEPYARESHGETRRAVALTPAIAARFGDADRRLVREVLARSGVLPAVRRELVRDTAAAMAPRLGIPAPKRYSDALAVLKELYLYLRERR